MQYLPEGLSEFRFVETFFSAPAALTLLAKASSNRVILVLSSAGVVNYTTTPSGNTSRGINMNGTFQTLKFTWQDDCILVNQPWLNTQAVLGGGVSVFEVFYEPKQ